MKALAAEMTNYFGKRLEPLGITVKELTGDMQLTKGEILRTQVNTHTHTQFTTQNKLNLPATLTRPLAPPAGSG